MNERSKYITAARVRAHVCVCVFREVTVGEFNLVMVHSALSLTG